jgi:hypothetical protein
MLTWAEDRCCLSPSDKLVPHHATNKKHTGAVRGTRMSAARVAAAAARSAFHEGNKHHTITTQARTHDSIVSLSQLLAPYLGTASALSQCS